MIKSRLNLKTIIAGSRGITDYDLMIEAIRLSGFTITEVCCGGATGVDSLGDRWAREHKVPIKYFLPKWDLLGKSAGPVRNRFMADYADAAIILWGGDRRSSPGSYNMIQEAHDGGLKVYVHNTNKREIQD